MCKEIPFNLKIELAKQDYVKAINEVTNRYNIPITVLETILGQIHSEVYKMKIQQIETEKLEYNKEEASDGEN